MWLKKTKTINYLSKKKKKLFMRKIEGVHEGNISILNSNSNVTRESLVLACDQCMLEIPSEASELRTLSTQGCCAWWLGAAV